MPVEIRDQQKAENQLCDYRCKRSWTITGEYVDLESGTLRPFSHAPQLKFNAIPFWALDRFSREGVRETLNDLKQLEDMGGSFKSYTKKTDSKWRH